MAKKSNKHKGTHQQSRVNPVAEPATVRIPNVKATTKKTSRSFSSQNRDLLFNKTNYILMIAGFALVLIGFILMSGGNTDPKVFNEAEIYSTRRITVAPIVIIIGFITIAVGILKKPSSDNTNTYKETVEA